MTDNSPQNGNINNKKRDNVNNKNSQIWNFSNLKLPLIRFCIFLFIYFAVLISCFYFDVELIGFEVGKGFINAFIFLFTLDFAISLLVSLTSLFVFLNNRKKHANLFLAVTLFITFIIDLNFKFMLLNYNKHYFQDLTANSLTFFLQQSFLFLPIYIPIVILYFVFRITTQNQQ